MVTLRPLDVLETTSFNMDIPDINTLPSYHRLTLWNGFLIGLAITTGFWASKLYTFAQLPVAKEFYISGAAASSLLIIFLCILIGGISGRLNKIWLTIFLWLLGGITIPIILGYLPAYGQNLSVWLTDKRFVGLTVYAIPTGDEWWSFVIAGIALIFILFILSVLQAIRLERAFNNLRPGGRLSSNAFFVLLLPTLFASLGALIMPDHLSSAPRQALAITHEAIQTVQNFEGDRGELFDLAKRTGFNYSALNGVRDQLVGSYSLLFAEIDRFGSQVTIMAYFDSGAWISCQINAFAGRAEYFSFCSDASRPYTEGFASLITGEPIPENCFGCLPQADDAWQAWLRDRQPKFTQDISFTRLAQHGNSVWMRAASSDGSYAVDCLFMGIADLQIMECRDVKE